MAQNGCYNSFQVCGMRVARLSATGAPVSGSNQGYVSGAPIQVQISPDYEAGVELSKTNGCGRLCGYFKDQDQLKKYDISFSLCELDHELIEILTGSNVTAIGRAGLTIGHQFPRVSSCSPVTNTGVSLEFWSKRWDNCSPPADNDLYWHWAFPRAYLSVGEITMENDFMEIPITGYLEENPNWGNGPWNDYAGQPNDLEAIGAVWQDTTVPTAVCGWTTVPTQT